jgi:hypothetical protein
MAAWIRIHVPNADPDPGGLKRAKMKEKNATKRQIFRLKNYKKQCYWYKNGKMWLYFQKM